MSEAEKIKALATIFSTEDKVTRYNDGDYNEAWTLAHGLIDIEESSKKIADQISQLLKGDPKIDAYEQLLDIGEELRHILYHINDTKFYAYLKEEV